MKADAKVKTTRYRGRLTAEEWGAKSEWEDESGSEDNLLRGRH